MALIFMSSLWDGSCSNAINVLQMSSLLLSLGFSDQRDEQVMRKCSVRRCQRSYWPPRWTSLCFIYRSVLPQVRIFRSFRWQGNVAVSNCNNFWDVEQICGCIQQVASTARRIMAGQRSFCQVKLPMLLSMCMCVHEQNIQINGNLCQSFVSLEGAGALVLFWVLLIMHGVFAIFNLSKWLSHI